MAGGSVVMVGIQMMGKVEGMRRFAEAHGMIFRRDDGKRVWLASAAVVGAGYLCSDLSGPIGTFQELRDWLGY